jgi:ArsR family transcriptional regulator
MPANHEICKSGISTIAHMADVASVQKQLPRDEDIYELSDFFKVLGDSTRIKILFALFSSEICVQCLAELLNMNQSAVSHQLRVLKQSRLVKFRKAGKFKFYSLDDEHVCQLIVLGMSHLTEGVDKNQTTELNAAISRP